MIVLAPNSFKGSLTSTECALAMRSGILRVWPDAECKLLPMADGGEGTLDSVLKALGGEIKQVSIRASPFSHVQTRISRYGVLPDGAGVIEVADLIGLHLGARDAAARTSFAVGALLQHCLNAGIRDFLIGLGGSGTNDAGAGMLSALGVRYYDGQGKQVAGTPTKLGCVASIDFSGLDTRLKASRITLLADVNNILCGEMGATYVFGPQKGIAPAAIPVIDANITHFAKLGDDWAGHAVSQAPGAGAAGGLGYALQLLGATHASGAEVIAELIKLDEHLQSADWALTGEGKSDMQTLAGKAPFVVAQYAKKHHVPITLISGDIDPTALPELRHQFDECFALIDLDTPPGQAMANAALLVADRAEQAARARGTRIA